MSPADRFRLAQVPPDETSSCDRGLPREGSLRRWTRGSRRGVAAPRLSPSERWGVAPAGRPAGGPIGRSGVSAVACEYGERPGDDPTPPGSGRADEPTGPARPAGPEGDPPGDGRSAGEREDGDGDGAGERAGGSRDRHGAEEGERPAWPIPGVRRRRRRRPR